MAYKYNPFTRKLDRVIDGDSAGDVEGPGSSTDNAVVRFDGTTGKLIQNSNAILDDAGTLTLALPLPVGSGGTGIASTPSNGELLIGNGTNYTSANLLTSDGNIEVTNGSGSIDINLSDNLTVTSLSTDDAAKGLTISSNEIAADGTDTNINIKLTCKGSGGLINPTNMTVGDTSQNISFTLNGTSRTANCAVHEADAAILAGLSTFRYGNTATIGSQRIYLRSRGTKASPTIVQNGDAIMRVIAAGYDGTDYAQCGEIRIAVDGVPGSNDMPGRIRFYTSPNGSQTLTLAMTINSSQNVVLTNPLAITSGGTGSTTIATTSQAGVSELATSAEVTTGTDTDRVPSVSSMIGHEGIAKAWCNFDMDGTFNDGFNISSVTDGGTGIATVNYTTSFGDANYCAVASARETTEPVMAMIDAQAAGSTEIHFRGGDIGVIGGVAVRDALINPDGGGNMIAIGDR